MNNSPQHESDAIRRVRQLQRDRWPHRRDFVRSSLKPALEANRITYW